MPTRKRQIMNWDHVLSMVGDGVLFGSLFGVLVAGLVGALRGSRGRARHGLWMGAIGGILAGFLIGCFTDPMDFKSNKTAQMLMLLGLVAGGTVGS